mmetsp:Transcript_32251/g.51713  ORF Transcript_32251/g.51713 Transcript_32251/m.51713 type:complete len:557 (-) Transcript_32251:297-1967(-)|eukprot:CAMPEP_0197050054 /NCGR_PEP_ID=MMETSP1384-20130603/25046_1 /TAXON_ID=29189 /ORGANISM="Ammonia sp." /LENGTH=556 /DNA_ID=CAMNT_0042482415 /DNA_START=35 /DNA_END=1705 /DNA_ORIENTATION=-
MLPTKTCRYQHKLLQRFSLNTRYNYQSSPLLIASKSLRHQSDSTQNKLPPTETSSTSSGESPKQRAFIDYDRHADEYRPALERITDWNEINQDPTSVTYKQRQTQAARCMDCGTPFCQSFTGCPLNNLIPEWNNLVYENNWRLAIERLHKTNNFPEFTGRVCPAPCEGACVVGLVDQPVTIKNIEYSIVHHAFEQGWIQPRIPSQRTGLHVAVIGSGPAGLAAADLLNQCGHTVHVYEREDQIGGLLMYGIPNMKLSKDTVRRRVDLLEKEGIVFHTNANVDAEEAIKLKKSYEAMVLCIGSTVPRDLPSSIPGRELNGIHYAMEFLTRNMKHVMMNKQTGDLQSKWDSTQLISAKDKHVIVIGGGDTGCDCIGTAMRHQAKSVLNLELMSKPPAERDEAVNPWPQYPRVYSLDYGHEEVKARFGYDPRNYNISTQEFIADSEGNVKGLRTVQVDRNFNVIADSERVYPADLVLLAMGFTNPETEILEALNIDAKQNKNGTLTVDASPDDYKTNIDGVFAAGDCRRGQSLVVWAIAEGRAVANNVQEYFQAMGYLQ